MADITNGCGRQREPRLWTLDAYAGLSEDLVRRYGAKAVMCACFRGINYYPAEAVDRILGQLEDATGEDSVSAYLKGVLAALIVLWGYLKKVRGARLYRMVLRKFILLSLLVEGLNMIVDKLTGFLQAMILSLTDLEELHKLLDCREKK